MEYDILRDLDEAEQRRVLAATTRRKYTKGAALFYEGDPGEALHLIAKGRVATVAITAMTFVEPIKVGDWVSIYGEVSKVGRTSITIALETVVQRRNESTERRVTHGTFVFVAIDDEGKPRPVPQAASPVATA